MEGSSDYNSLVLRTLTNEVDDVKLQAILATQIYKAQTHLADKLKKKAELEREKCSFNNDANLRLEAEIKNAQKQISSLLLAYDLIRSANVEIRKNWVLAKEKKPDMIERIGSNVKKYEARWLECKNRYESIPFVQKFLQATEKVQKLKTDVVNVESEAQKIYEEIKTRQVICIDLGRNRVIAIAKFMIEELPTFTKIINEKNAVIDDLTKNIEKLMKEKNISDIKNNDADRSNDDKLTTLMDYEQNTQLGKDVPLIPELQLANFDFDNIDIDLDTVKKSIETLETVPSNPKPLITNLETNKYYNKVEDFIISPYFHKPVQQENFSRRKLINILEDIKIDKQEAYNIVSKINLEKMQTVNVICPEDGAQKNVKDKTPLESEDIEVIDMTASNTENNIIIPPTQFLDMAIQGPSKKKVSFDIPSAVSTPNEDVKMQYTCEENQLNQTTNSDVCAENEDRFMQIKDMIIKKHNLDLSPQFVYAKNTLMPKANDEVTSKFFTHDGSSKIEEKQTDDNKMDTDNHAEILAVVPANTEQQQPVISVENDPKANVTTMDVDEIVVTSPKKHKEPEVHIREKPICGLLFTHGIKAIPDSLDVSISTTGYDDSDFPHCIDSSLLLSPKADVPMTGVNDKISEEVPNFLSGLRKTGLSFFGAGPSTEPKPESSEQNQGSSFNFNFGGEKKTRGGLFNMFR